MSDKPRPTPIEGLTTPIVFFDNVTNQGFSNGIANIPLTAFRYRPDEGGKIRAEEILAVTNQVADGPKN